MLQALNLSKSYGTHTALDTLNLFVARGEIFCLLGANGAGKSTTLHLFLNLIDPTEGEARIDGRDVRHTRASVAYIPEQVALYPSLTGLENLDYFLRLSGKRLKREDLPARLQEAGLDPAFADIPAARYSKGMRQKVALAAARGREAEVMILDEPTSGLDPQAAGELAARLAALKAGGTTVLMATHDLWMAHAIADRVGIMSRGTLKAQIDPRDIDASTLKQRYLEPLHD